MPSPAVAPPVASPPAARARTPEDIAGCAEGPDVNRELVRCAQLVTARDAAGGYAMNDRRALGLHFVNTKNFKPPSAPRWQDAPALDLDE